ncbi:Hypothetical protein, putative, partial [Bodo saltans]
LAVCFKFMLRHSPWCLSLRDPQFQHRSCYCPLNHSLGDRLLQTAGLKMVFNNLLSETRLLSVHILNSATGSYEELNRIAVDSYMATIFSPFPSFFNARYDGEVARRTRTIKLTQTAVVTYMAELSFVNTTNQGNLMIDNTSINVLNLVQTQTDCVSGTFWHPSTGSCMACPQGTSSTPGAINCSISPPICPSSGGPMGLFRPMGLFIDPDCAEPFDCHVSFCNCVGSPLSTTCTPFATNATATQSHNNTPTIDLTKSQSFKAYASSANTADNCSTFDYNPYLRFSWSLSAMNGAIIFATSTSQLFLPALLRTKRTS